MVVVSPLRPPYSPNLVPCDFFFVPRDESGFEREEFSNGAEVQQECSVLDSIYVEDFSQCLQQWQWRWDRCIQSQGRYCDGD